MVRFIIFYNNCHCEMCRQIQLISVGIHERILWRRTMQHHGCCLAQYCLGHPLLIRQDSWERLQRAVVTVHLLQEKREINECTWCADSRSPPGLLGNAGGPNPGPPSLMSAYRKRMPNRFLLQGKCMAAYPINDHPCNKRAACVCKIGTCSDRASLVGGDILVPKWDVQTGVVFIKQPHQHCSCNHDKEQTLHESFLRTQIVAFLHFS